MTRRRGIKGWERMRVHFMDEGWPQIGTGWRAVLVKRGRKWVHVREVDSPRGARRFTRTLWSLIEERTARQQERG